ncbi:hypothetical protein ACFSVM_20290 [Paenibacillus shunpengii]|uniref:Uncharacterized protein n=1 Tax=Paenibacillus shunpengii TaxID=2054424 RepID=A0ABW5ST54_9BACL
MVNVADANDYISANCIDIEDWTDADEAKKQRIVNVASRTLTVKYPTYTIPDAAVYEFANVLAVVFNDTNRLAQHGITGFTLDKVGSFDYKDSSVSGPDHDLSKLIPRVATALIGAENGVNPLLRKVGRLIP